MSLEKVASAGEAVDSAESTADNVSFSEEERVFIEQHQIDTKSMLRKIDWIILPILFLTYALQFMDKIALSSASVFGVIKDNHLVGQQYSWVSSIFYFGFMAGQFPATRMLQLVPIGKFMGITVVLFGVVLACTAASSSYAGLLATRFFLGFLESAVSPTAVLLSSIYYTPQQIPLRTGIWFSGNDFGGVISGFITFGLGHIHGTISSWKYIFIVYGCLSFLWGIIILFVLPDSPGKARFFSVAEKEYFAKFRSQSHVSPEWQWDQVRECFLDIKTWLLVIITVLNILPNGGIISYGFIVLNGFGFSAIDVTLLGVPGSVITWIAIVGTGWVSSRYKNFRCYMIMFTVLLPIAGAALVYKVDKRGLKLLGYYLLMIQPATFPCVLSLVASNYRGSSKRVTISAIIFVFYCASNIGAPQLFIHREAPRYPTAFRSWIVCFCLTIFFAVVLRLYLMWENRKKQKKVEQGHSVGVETGMDELTDKQDVHFLYYY